MLRCRAVFLSAVLAATAPACVRDGASVRALTHALRREYPGARFDVRIENSGHRLDVQVDSAAWRNYRVATSDLRTRGQAIARFALQHYGAAADLDSVNIDFVQERSGALLWKSAAFTRTTFAAGEVR